MPLMSLNPPRSQTQVISMMGTAMTDTTHPGPGHLQEAAAVVTPVMTPATHTVEITIWGMPPQKAIWRQKSCLPLYPWWW
ncbi:uncharacterized protein LOC118142883 isoform X1 [Callithrix jacchus]|uniref:glycoprotein Xg isoform X1 n=1 Tax=Callithrix jacchus TaxID=9483 RepID=UPI00159F6343|nr:glycoprotein Xg isoform X1 [Callithrix jacchus]